MVPGVFCALTVAVVIVYITRFRYFMKRVIWRFLTKTTNLWFFFNGVWEGSGWENGHNSLVLSGVFFLVYYSILWVVQKLYSPLSVFVSADDVYCLLKCLYLVVCSSPCSSCF